jgi:hypothetical protein
MSAGACSVAVDSPRLEMTVAGPTVVLGQAKRHAEQRAVLAARADVKDAIVFSKRGPRAVETVNRGNPPVRFFFCSDNPARVGVADGRIRRYGASPKLDSAVRYSTYTVVVGSSAKPPKAIPTSLVLSTCSL